MGAKWRGREGGEGSGEKGKEMKGVERRGKEGRKEEVEGRGGGKAEDSERE